MVNINHRSSHLKALDVAAVKENEFVIEIKAGSDSVLDWVRDD